MKKTFTLCQIAIDLPFQNEQLTVHDLPLSNDGEHDPIEIRSFSCLADAQAELEATRSSINLRRDFEHSPKAWVGTVFFLSELIQDGSSFHSGPDRTGPISIEQWVPCLSDIDPLDILEHSGCTRREAQRHLQTGAAVYAPEDFVQSLRDDLGEEDQAEALSAYGCHSFDQLLSLCRAGQLHGDCIANGIFPAGSASIPYVITFVL